MNIISTSSAYSYSVLNDDLKKLLSEYSFLEKIKIGNSVLGKELFCIKLGDGDKKVFINASHHGKEWITSMLVMCMLEKLCFLYVNKNSIYSFDIEKICKATSLYICPMVNPDGVDLSINGLTEDIPPITKTRLISYNNNSKDFIGKWQANANGVDLNHNYDAGFSKGKALEAKEGIFTPGPTRFSGHHPFSEPETLALSAFTKSLMPDVTVSYHAQGEEIYYDYEGLAPQLSKKMAFDMAQISGYKACEPEGMASFSGYKDWAIEKLHIPSFTIEVGKGENPLPICQFEEIFLRNFPMLLYLMNKC